MRRNALIAALLLPLPFAALPVIGVLLGMSSPDEIVIDARVAEQSAPKWDLPRDEGSLAYGVADTSKGDCADASVSRIEG